MALRIQSVLILSQRNGFFQLSETFQGGCPDRVAPFMRSPQLRIELVEPPAFAFGPGLSLRFCSGSSSGVLANLARVLAQSRRDWISSRMVRDNGMIELQALSTGSGGPSNRESLASCSISAPVQPDSLSANDRRMSEPCFLFMMRMISLRSGRVGRSTKNRASNRPARRNSGAVWRRRWRLP